MFQDILCMVWSACTRVPRPRRTQESHDREAENKRGRPHAGPYFGRDFCVTHRHTTKYQKSVLPCRAIQYSPLAGSQWNAP